MGTAFSYQSRLMDANKPADGEYDFQFKLFDDANVTDGNQVGSDVNMPDVDVVDGHFTVELDFGSDVFDGDARWLEVVVRPGDSNDVNDFVTLSPRQEVTPTPYAFYAKSAGSDSDWVVSGNDMYSIPSGNVGISKTSPLEKLDVNGNININSVYKIAGDTVLSVTSINNTLVGVDAGANNTGGYGTFVGYNAGYNNQGLDNTFLGQEAGFTNTTGNGNTFLGGLAGYKNTDGGSNTFVGQEAGYSNTTGCCNAFLGIYAGSFNTTGNANTFVGQEAGNLNTQGNTNTFLGYQAGYFNTTANDNTFVGANAGYVNTVGFGNSAMGQSALYNNITGYWNSAMGYAALVSNTHGVENTAMGSRALFNNISGRDNTAMGCDADWYNQQGSRNTIIGYQAGKGTALHNKSGNVFLGYKAGYHETGSNKLYIANGPNDANVLIYGDFSTGNVGIGTTNPHEKLHVGGSTKIEGDLIVDGNDAAFRGTIGPNNGAPFPRPAYDSGWQTINAPQSLQLIHNIGGNVDNYVVDLQFKDTGSFGINQRYYGGVYSGLSELGSFWQELTSTSIRVIRLKNDTVADQVRVRIWVYK